MIYKRVIHPIKERNHFVMVQCTLQVFEEIYRQFRTIMQSFHMVQNITISVTCFGSRDGAVVRALASHQCVPGSIPGPGIIFGLSLLLVLFSAPRGFSPGTPVFPSPQRPTFTNSNSSLESVPIYCESARRLTLK